MLPGRVLLRELSQAVVSIPPCKELFGDSSGGNSGATSHLLCKQGHHKGVALDQRGRKGRPDAVPSRTKDIGGGCEVGSLYFSVHLGLCM